jgi:putative hydrolase of the HAD superfamily
MSADVALLRKADFSAIDTWIFDLDNTLYPASCNLFDQIHRRMGEFISALLGVEIDEAKRLQKLYFREHGTTLRGLMTVHKIDPRDFLDHVHQIDLAAIPADAALGAALAALPGRKLVFTNGTVRHAENILAHLGIQSHFAGLFDIAACDHVPKPDPAGYDALVRRFGIAPARAAMIEDMAKNLAPAAALGMTTVWLRGTIDWAREGAEAAYVHHVADSLAPFLAEIVAQRGTAQPIAIDTPEARPHLAGLSGPSTPDSPSEKTP